MVTRCLRCDGDDVVENSALGKAFFYCRTCKDEVTPVFSFPNISEAAVMDFAEEFAKQVKIAIDKASPPKSKLNVDFSKVKINKPGSYTNPPDETI